MKYKSLATDEPWLSHEFRHTCIANEPLPPLYPSDFLKQINTHPDGVFLVPNLWPPAVSDGCARVRWRGRKHSCVCVCLTIKVVPPSKGVQVFLPATVVCTAEIPPTTSLPPLLFMKTLIACPRQFVCLTAFPRWSVNIKKANLRKGGQMFQHVRDLVSMLKTEA